MTFLTLMDKIYNICFMLKIIGYVLFRISFYFLIFTVIYRKFVKPRFTKIIIIIYIINCIIIVFPNTFILSYEYFKHIYYKYSYLNKFEDMIIQLFLITIVFILNLILIPKKKDLIIEAQKNKKNNIKFFSIFSIPNNKIYALCYSLGFITAIFFLIPKKNRGDYNIKYHAFQSILFSTMYALYIILYLVILRLIYPNNLTSTKTITILLLIIHSMFFYIWLHLIIKSYNNENVKLPIIGKLSSLAARNIFKNKSNNA